MTAVRSYLQRPAGYAPKGTSLGLLGCSMLTLSPFMTTVSLIPVLADGVGFFLSAIAPSFLAFIPFALIMALGLHKRRLWYVRFLFSWGAAGLTCYAVGILIMLAVLLHIVPEQHPELRALLIMPAIGWTYFTVCAFWVVRILRMHYWQPWSRPEQWEPGDETPPRWAPRPINR